jgi:hypothetical protein
MRFETEAELLFASQSIVWSLYIHTYIYEKRSLDNGYLDKEFSNKYEKKLWIYSSTYRLMVIQISCNFIIVLIVH